MAVRADNTGRLHRASFQAAASLVVSGRQTTPPAKNNRNRQPPTLCSTVRAPSPAATSETVAMTPVAPAAPIALEVHSLDGNVVLQAEVPASMRMGTIKCQVQAAVGVEIDRLQLLWHGNLLKDHDVLGEFDASNAGDGARGGEPIDTAMILQLCILDFPEEAARALQQAAEAIDHLEKRSVSELKGFGKPPPECVEVCAAVAFLLWDDRKKRDWKGSQKMMRNPDAFIDACKSFDAKDIPGRTLRNVDELLSLHFFTYDGMKCKSIAAASLANWVINVVAYHRIYKQVTGNLLEGPE